jgi:hypothetical protein
MARRKVRIAGFRVQKTSLTACKPYFEAQLRPSGWEEQHGEAETEKRPVRS